MIDPNGAGLHRRAVLLRHQCGAASHYDLMIEDPAAPAGEGPLLTWRIAEPSWRWAGLRQVELHAIAAHRRDYLTYEGPLGGGRGEVSRVDEGEVVARNWSADGGAVDLCLTHFAGSVELRRAESARWIMSIKKGSAT